jgi:hypothetical protein
MEDNREERDKERRRGNLVYRSGDNDTIVNLMRVEFEGLFILYFPTEPTDADTGQIELNRIENKTITDT